MKSDEQTREPEPQRPNGERGAALCADAISKSQILIARSQRGSRSQRFRIIDDEAMLREPDQEYLIERVCSVGSLVLMHGQSGAGKSFVGADVAFSVASGRRWHGHAVKQGSVIYIAAEGQGGFKDRIRAWKTGHGIEAGRVVGVHFILQPVDPLNSDDVHALVELLRRLKEPPALSIVDTWSACLGVGGGNENETKDTSQAVAAWRRVITEIGTAVWIIHHQGHSAQDRARGNSALKAAAETEIAVRQDKGSVIHVENKKQRDWVPFENMRFKLHVVPLGDGRDSCILVPADASAVSATSPRLSPRAETALGALQRAADELATVRGEESCGVTYSLWHEASGLPETTFRRTKDELIDGGYVEKSGEGRGGVYVLTESGRNYRHSHLTATSPPQAVAREATLTATSRHTPVGGGAGGNGDGETGGDVADAETGTDATEDAA